jgi:hypothetical protein
MIFNNWLERWGDAHSTAMDVDLAKYSGVLNATQYKTFKKPIQMSARGLP